MTIADDFRTVLDVPLTRAQAARLIGVSERWVNELEDRGYIHKLERGLYDAADVAQGYARSLADDKRTTAQSAAQARLIQARAQALELKTQREAGDLCPTYAIENYGRSVFGKVRAEHVALPAQFTRDLSERDRLALLVDQMETRLADFFDAEGDRLWQEAIKSGRRRAA
jgi:phage terminase Nu1 subunit (DNA packaging protein)